MAIFSKILYYGPMVKRSRHRPVSYTHLDVYKRQVDCYIAFTNEETHRGIHANLHRSPWYGGKIEGVGPRYCPSIEDKVVRFAEKPRHQIFVEPCGLATEEMYLQGMSSSLPEAVQNLSLIHI